MAFQFLVVVGEVLVFKVFLPDRVQQRRPRPPRNAFLSGLWSRSFVFPVKAFKILVQDRFRQRLRLFNLLLVETMTLMSLVMGFSHFSPGKKVRSAGQVSADLLRHISPWTPAAYEQSRRSHEQEVEIEKKKAEYERRMLVINQRVADGLLIDPKDFEAWCRWSGLPPSSYSSGKSRKRKKRRKKKTPKSSSFRYSSGVRPRRCGRLRDFATSSSSRGGHSCYACRDVYPQCKLYRRPSFLQVLFLDSASAWHWWCQLRSVTQP